MNNFLIEPEKTALVLIDLQKAIVGMPGDPHDTSTVVRYAAQLADAFRQAGSFVVYVCIDFAAKKGTVRPVVERSLPKTNVENGEELASGLQVHPDDYFIKKPQIGAFFGTDLDVQLRTRGIDTIVLGGISTHFGVEGTAREAFQLNYNQIFVTDAMTAPSRELHEFPCKYIFPFLGRLGTTEEVLASLQS